MICPHCTMSLSVHSSTKHVDRCATATPAERDHYRRRRCWPDRQKRPSGHERLKAARASAQEVVG